MTETTVRHVEVTDADSEALLADVAHYARLANAVCSADTGHDDFSTTTVADGLGMLRDRVDRVHDLFLVDVGGRVVGAAMTNSLARGAESIETDLMVDPDRWDDAVADALLDATTGLARERGIRVVQAWTLHRPGTPQHPASPSTGRGVVDGAAPLAAFLASRGFTLEQVERNSRFDLQGPLDLVERALEGALAAAGPDYEVRSYTDVCPDDLVDSFATTISRMSTDAPQGGLVVTEDVMDAARVRRREARTQSQGHTTSVTLAVHAPTGTVAAYNELVLSQDHREPTMQYGTLVLREHRGHRLGTVVKCAGLLRIRELAPESPAVATFNAEENAHMLAINVAIGFAPASYAGAWKLVLPA